MRVAFGRHIGNVYRAVQRLLPRGGTPSALGVTRSRVLPSCCDLVSRFYEPVASESLADTDVIL